MLCDYPDLYDFGGESSGVGHFCLMCAGNQADEKNPVGISAYLKRLSGWAGAVLPLEHGRTLTLAAGSNQMAMLAKNDDEYFLVENRHQAGRDAALPGSGLAIWHVDEQGNNSHEAMTSAAHYELSLKQADGLFQLERTRSARGDANDLYAGAAARFADDTTPSSKWWDGTPSHLVIDQVSASGASVTLRCTFDNVAVPAGGATRRDAAPQRPIPDNDANGIADSIDIADAATIADLQLGVDIAHSYRGDLELRLVAPWGAAIVLHPKGQGGNAADLRATYDASTTPGLGGWRGRAGRRRLAPGGARPGAGRPRHVRKLVAADHTGGTAGRPGGAGGIARRGDPRCAGRGHRTQPQHRGTRHDRRRGRRGDGGARHHAQLHRRPARRARLARRHRGDAA